MNLSPFAGREQNAKKIRKLRLKVWSLQKLGGKSRFHYWTIADKSSLALGNTVHHFQFGHFQPTIAEGFFLRLKFAKSSLRKPKMLMKYVLVAKDRGNNRLMDDRDLTEPEWKGEEEFSAELDDAAVQSYLKQHAQHSIYLAIKEVAADYCSICHDTRPKGEKKRKLAGCAHYFHDYCIKKWVKEQKSGNAKANKCPTCDHELVKTKAYTITPAILVPIMPVSKYTLFVEEKTIWNVFLPMPILQNGNKPYYTYNLDLVKHNFLSQKWNSFKKPLEYNLWAPIEKPAGKTAGQIVAEHESLKDEEKKELKSENHQRQRGPGPGAADQMFDLEHDPFDPDYVAVFGAPGQPPPPPSTGAAARGGGGAAPPAAAGGAAPPPANIQNDGPDHFVDIPGGDEFEDYSELHWNNAGRGHAAGMPAGQVGGGGGQTRSAGHGGDNDDGFEAYHPEQWEAAGGQHAARAHPNTGNGGGDDGFQTYIPELWDTAGAGSNQHQRNDHHHNSPFPPPHFTYHDEQQEAWTNAGQYSDYDGGHFAPMGNLFGGVGGHCEGGNCHYPPPPHSHDDFHPQPPSPHHDGHIYDHDDPGGLFDPYRPFDWTTLFQMHQRRTEQGY